MDRIGPRFAILNFSLTLIAASALAGAATPQAHFPIRSAQWLDPAQRLTELSSQPYECAAIPRDRAERSLFETGRAAFRTPLLVGGQAARSGLACASCHSNGRRNPAFHFPGVSGDPGTADVTSSLMSSHRGNGLFDPKPIPDLALPGRISRARGDPALEAFIRGLIVEEFDGAVPPRPILQGLGVYVRSLGQSACDLSRRKPIRLGDMMLDIARAVTASRQAWTSGNAETARLLIAGARSGLGLVNERYAAPELSRDREAIRIADRELLAIQQVMDGKRGDVAARIAAWQSSFVRLAMILQNGQKRSLFDAVRLRQQLNR